MDPTQKRTYFFEKTAYTLLQTESFVTSGCKIIDSALRGGFSRKGITQIYGQAGSGKTQFALQLCLTVQIPDKNTTESAGAVYICTEAHFPSRRLQDLLKKSYISKKYSVSGDLIFVEHVPFIDKLEECICQKLSCLLEQQNIGLLVVDSIAAPFRIEYDENELKDRATHLKKIGEKLHFISKVHNICVICINQVSAAVESDLTKMDGSEELPTLGITWANFVSHSFHLLRKGDRRYMYIMHSSYLARQSIQFEIRDFGIIGVQ